METSLFRRWWFWVALVVLFASAVYLRGYFEWRGEQAGADTRNVLSYMYWQYLENQSKQLEEAYRNDPYGGDTPEETLRLYVEALENNDQKLAAKYFIPENQKEELARYSEGIASGGLKAFVNAYRNGKVIPPEAVGSSGIYEFELFEPGETVPFGLRLIQNEFTGKWKIIE